MISGTDKDIRKIEKMMRNQTIVYAIVESAEIVV